MQRWREGDREGRERKEQTNGLFLLSECIKNGKAERKVELMNKRVIAVLFLRLRCWLVNKERLRRSWSKVPCQNTIRNNICKKVSTFPLHLLHYCSRYKIYSGGEVEWGWVGWGGVGWGEVRWGGVKWIEVKVRGYFLDSTFHSEQSRVMLTREWVIPTDLQPERKCQCLLTILTCLSLTNGETRWDYIYRFWPKKSPKVLECKFYNKTILKKYTRNQIFHAIRCR